MSRKCYIVCQFDISNDIFHLAKSTMLMIFVTGTILFLQAINAQWQDSSTSTLDARQVQQVLSLHNQLRARYGAPPLVYDEKLAVFGKNYLDTLGSCDLVHNSNRCGFSPSTPIGENLGFSMGTSTLDIPFLVNGWIGEQQNYYGGSMPFSDGPSGHFTQMIWYDTKSIGCAWKQCGGSQTLVCDYFPTGNIIGKYVQRPNNIAGGYGCPVGNGISSGSGSDGGIGIESGSGTVIDYN